MQKKLFGRSNKRIARGISMEDITEGSEDKR